MTQKNIDKKNENYFIMYPFLINLFQANLQSPISAMNYAIIFKREKEIIKVPIIQSCCWAFWSSWQAKKIFPVVCLDMYNKSVVDIAMLPDLIMGIKVDIHDESIINHQKGFVYEKCNRLNEHDRYVA